MRLTPVFWWSLLAGDFTFHRLTTTWFAPKQAPTSGQMSLILEANGNELGQRLQSATTPPQRKNSRFIAATPQVSRRSRNATPTSRTPFPQCASLCVVHGPLSGPRPLPFVSFVVTPPPPYELAPDQRRSAVNNRSDRPFPCFDFSVYSVCSVGKTPPSAFRVFRVFRGEKIPSLSVSAVPASHPLFRVFRVCRGPLFRARSFLVHRNRSLSPPTSRPPFRVFRGPLFLFPFLRFRPTHS